MHMTRISLLRKGYREKPSLLETDTITKKILKGMRKAKKFQPLPTTKEKDQRRLNPKMEKDAVKGRMRHHCPGWRSEEKQKDVPSPLTGKKSTK